MPGADAPPRGTEAHARSANRGIYYIGKQTPGIGNSSPWTSSELRLSGCRVSCLLRTATGEGATPEQTAELRDVERMLAFSFVLLGGLPVVARFTLRRFQRRIGTDGRRLFVRHPDGGQVSFAPKQVVYSDRQIAYRDQVVAVQTGNRQPLYADGPISPRCCVAQRSSRRSACFGISSRTGRRGC